MRNYKNQIIELVKSLSEEADKRFLVRIAAILKAYIKRIEN